MTAIRQNRQQQRACYFLIQIIFFYFSVKCTLGNVQILSRTLPFSMMSLKCFAYHFFFYFIQRQGLFHIFFRVLNIVIIFADSWLLHRMNNGRNRRLGVAVTTGVATTALTGLTCPARSAIRLCTIFSVPPLPAAYRTERNKESPARFQNPCSHVYPAMREDVVYSAREDKSARWQR